MNVKLLRQLARKAEKLPKTFDMDGWARKVDKDKEHPCGSVGCIAGNAAIKAGIATVGPLGVTLPGGNWHEAGMDALDIAGWQATGLFYVGAWPSKYQDKYRRARSAAARGKVIAARIRAFIRSGGER